ncbi:unnamed protein product [Rotaria sp. Silwood2]|nr:unnamed protein product [Rotaria sp. Silwood2]CAF4625102.1 unnamed protein product [Rotaria sp. Silwood2]
MVQDSLDETFLHWIGRRHTIEWPSRSPDLTSCDFPLCGVMKDHVYAQSPRDINHRKSLTEQQFRSLNNNIELGQSICRSVADRCKMGMDVEGKQFEHFL